MTFLLLVCTTSVAYCYPQGGTNTLGECFGNGFWSGLGLRPRHSHEAGFYKGSALALAGIRGIVYCHHWQEQGATEGGAVLRTPEELAF